MTSPLRLVALATNPVDGASTRFRVLQWQEHLARGGFDLRLEAFLSKRASRILYQRGRRVEKVLQLTWGFVRRCSELLRISRTADVILVHREAFPLGWPLFLNRLRRFRGVIVYDYDDAMFLPQRPGRGILPWLEWLDTPARLMKMSHLVLAGNPFLVKYAREHAVNVVLLPTCIDTDRFVPADRLPDRARVTVGWIGSHTTSKYLEKLMPVLERVAAVTPFDLYVVGCPTRLYATRLSIVQREWVLEREVADFQNCDIGVYPLSNDDWSRGKSGFKAIQFMACGVPVVASAVGVTQQIIRDGQNGLLAENEDEWIEQLTRLVSDVALRRRLGNEGRGTVEQQYSVDANAPILLAALRDALDRCAGESRGMTTPASTDVVQPG